MNFNLDDFTMIIGNNVKTICFDTDSEMWTITYKNDLTPDVVNNDELIDFLSNH